MKKQFKWFSDGILILMIASSIGALVYYQDRLWLIAKYFEKGTDSPENLQPQKPKISLKNRAKEAYEYAKANGFDLEHTILIDFARHSGKNRFFVWDFKQKNHHRKLNGPWLW